MASFTLSSKALKINLTGREKRILSRPDLVVDKARLLTVDVAAFPRKAELGLRISKRSFLGGVLGEYRTSSKRSLVLGRLNGSNECLKIRISHPSIDEIWVFGSDGEDLRVRLEHYLRSTD